MSKQQTDRGINDVNLFDNPMIRNALKSLTPEQVKAYQKIGEQLYGQMDFETMGSNNITKDMKDAGDYIKEQIKSGLHPSELELNEKEIMKEVFGKDWYKTFGYTEADLDIKIK